MLIGHNISWSHFSIISKITFLWSKLDNKLNLKQKIQSYIALYIKFKYTVKLKIVTFPQFIIKKVKQK